MSSIELEDVYNLLIICEELRDSDRYQGNVTMETLYMHIASMYNQDESDALSSITIMVFQLVITEEILFQLGGAIRRKKLLLIWANYLIYSMKKMCQCGNSVSSNKHTYCDECNKARKQERNKQWFVRNKERRKTYDINRQKDHGRRYRLLKSNAKRKGRECLITFEEFVILTDAPCTYCNNLLSPNDKFSGTRIDRVNNSQPYTFANAKPCCDFCNSVKGDKLTYDETAVAIKAIIAFREINNEEKKETNSQNHLLCI